MRLCLRCGKATSAIRKEHRPVLCDACRRAWERERNEARPWYEGTWPRLRRRALALQPWCTRCGSRTDLEVDHVEGRTLDEGLQVLCRRCHQLKGANR